MGAAPALRIRPPPRRLLCGPAHLLSLPPPLAQVARPAAGPLVRWLLLLQGAEESSRGVQLRFQLRDLRKPSQTVADVSPGAHHPPHVSPACAQGTARPSPRAASPPASTSSAPHRPNPRPNPGQDTRLERSILPGKSDRRSGQPLPGGAELRRGWGHF